MVAAVRAGHSEADQDRTPEATEMSYEPPWNGVEALLLFLAFSAVMVIVAIFRDLTEPPEPPEPPPLT
jgi:hypothetical protein